MTTPIHETAAAPAAQRPQIPLVLGSVFVLAHPGFRRMPAGLVDVTASP